MGRWNGAARLAAALCVASVVLLAVPASAEQIDNAPGPITRILITPDLNCGVSFLGDSSPEFFADTACATFVSTATELFGPNSIPAGGSASPRTAFTPVSQVKTGTGTSGDPFRIETVVDAGTSGLRLTQVDTYVAGQNAYRTVITIANSGAAATDVNIYHAADCFLQDSDDGFGAFDPTTGAVSCVNGVDDGLGNTIPGPRIEQFIPLSGGSRFFESNFSAVWAAVGTRQPLPDTCAACDVFLDNGMGLSWSASVPAGGSVVRSLLTNFSPTGLVPLPTALTATPASVNGLDIVNFTASITNPNIIDLPVDSLSVTLPSGFTYVPGSTIGATSADPSIVGSVLTFTGPFVVGAGGATQSLTFQTRAVNVPGVYTSSVDGLAGAVPVLPSTDTAAVTVVAAAQITTTTPTTTNRALLARTGTRRGLEPQALVGVLLVGMGTALVSAASRRRRLATARHFTNP